MSLQFSKLVEMFEQLESVSSGNKMREILSKFFKKCPAKDMDIIAYLSLGKIDADYKHVELGMAEKMVAKSVVIASNKSGRNI